MLFFKSAVKHYSKGHQASDPLVCAPHFEAVIKNQNSLNLPRSRRSDCSSVSDAAK